MRRPTATVRAPRCLLRRAGALAIHAHPRAHAGNAHGARAVERRSWRSPEGGQLDRDRRGRPRAAAPRGRRPSRRRRGAGRAGPAEIPATSAAFGVLRARGAGIPSRSYTRSVSSARTRTPSAWAAQAVLSTVRKRRAAAEAVRAAVAGSWASWERARFSSASARACGIRFAPKTRATRSSALSASATSPASRRTSARSRSQIAALTADARSIAGRASTSTRSPRRGCPRAGRRSPRCARPSRARRRLRMPHSPARPAPGRRERPRAARPHVCDAAVDQHRRAVLAVVPDVAMARSSSVIAVVEVAAFQRQAGRADRRASPTSAASIRLAREPRGTAAPPSPGRPVASRPPRANLRFARADQGRRCAQRLEPVRGVPPRYGRRSGALGRDDTARPPRGSSAHDAGWITHREWSLESRSAEYCDDGIYVTGAVGDLRGDPSRDDRRRERRAAPHPVSPRKSSTSSVSRRRPSCRHECRPGRRPRSRPEPSRRARRPAHRRRPSRRCSRTGRRSGPPGVQRADGEVPLARVRQRSRVRRPVGRLVAGRADHDDVVVVPRVSVSSSVIIARSQPGRPASRGSS